MRKRFNNVEFKFERLSSFLKYVTTTEGKETNCFGADPVGVDVRVASSPCGFFLNQRMYFDLTCVNTSLGGYDFGELTLFSRSPRYFEMSKRVSVR